MKGSTQDRAAAKWCLVTGASSGIGAAYARALRRRGRRVVLVARRADRLATLASELGGEGQALDLPADLAREGEVERLCDQLAQRGLHLDLLVNNAGSGDTGAFASQPIERLTGMVDLNCRALVELTRRLLPGMLARRAGAIVNVVSTSAFQPVPYLTVYAATKSLVLSFTEGLATELRGSGVRVQALCPGLTETEFFEVARTGAGLKVNRLPRARPEAVVEASLRGLETGRLRVFPVLGDRVVAALVRVLPSALVRSVGAGLYRER